MYLFSSNKKLKHDNIFKWSLPAVSTCPGAGSCLDWCLFLGRVYPLWGDKCRDAHMRNYRLSLLPYFADMCIYELECRPVIRYLRIHDSGDFYSQGYLNKWRKIAEAVPNVIFYAYTKSLHLNFDRFKALKNTKIIQSSGGKYKIDKRKAHAILLRPGQLVPMGYVNGSRSDRVVFKSNKIALYKRG